MSVRRRLKGVSKTSSSPTIISDIMLLLVGRRDPPQDRCGSGYHRENWVHDWSMLIYQDITPGGYPDISPRESVIHD